MLRLLADENFDNDIVRGVLRRTTQVDLVRVQDVGLGGVEDPDVLAWAAQENRILLTHDVATVTKYAYDRIAVGAPMPGVFEVRTCDEITLTFEDCAIILKHGRRPAPRAEVRGDLASF